MAEGQPEAKRGRSEARSGRLSALRMDLVVFVVVAASLLLPIASVGLWDPFELDVAEAARRIAVNLLGGEHLTIQGALNDVPIRRELGRGELPFTSVALGFRLLGLSDWAGRLPLAIWAFVGVLATFSLVRRFSDRRTARIAALVLSVTPLYFLSARTLSGDAATMGSVAIAVRGLSGVLWGPADGRGFKVRALWLLVSACGLYAGFWARGLLIGVVIPMLGVASGWFATAAADERRNWLAWALLLAGTLAAVVGGWQLFRAGDGAEYSVLLGTRVVAPGDAADHDSVLQFLAHGAFPVSVLLPFAVGRLFNAPPGEQRELGLRGITIGCLVVAFGVHGVLAPFTGSLPFAGTFACAVAVALLLRDLNLRPVPSRAFALGVVAVAVLLLHDFDEGPDKAFSAFSSTSAVFPSALVPFHRVTWLLAAASVSMVFLFTVADRRSPTAPRFDWRRDYLPYLRALKTAYGGNLWFLLSAVSAGLVAWALLLWVSDNYLHIPEISDVWSVVRSIAYNAWWAVPTLVLLLPLLVIAVGDAFRSLFLPGFGWFEHPALRRLRFTRTSLCAGTLVAAGLFLSLGYYPRLMNQLSPKQVFARYEELATGNQPLGLLRLGGSAADYYARGRTMSMESVSAAFKWLSASGERRFLMVHAPDLPELNAMFRRERTQGGNLPVVDARSSEILLLSNQLGRGELNHNPFDAWILDKRPLPDHAMSANLGNRLEVLGWELRDLEGDLARSIRANVPYELTLYYEVTGPVETEWETFVHIDGYRRRYNGDHETLQGKYPLKLLNKGDFVADKHVIELSPNFTPGIYRLFFGLYRGSRRMRVERGKHDDDRLEAGPIPVR